MEKELVSVIMPAYNAEKYIYMSIESVMQQTYRNVELIIVDDGSQDSTLEIMRACVEKWPDKIRIFAREQNGGTAAALNDAIEMAQGNYICWLSADDLYNVDMIRSEVAYLKENGQCDAVFSKCAFIDGEGKFLREQVFAVDEAEFGRGMKYMTHLLLLLNFWHGCTLLARAECFKKEEKFNTEYKAAQDYDFWIRMVADHDIGYLNQINVLSREHSEQGSRKLNCRLDEIRVFFNILYREDIMLKLFRKMDRKYTYENVRLYIEYRIEKYKGLEDEMKILAICLRKYMAMMANGELHFQE